MPLFTTPLPLTRAQRLRRWIAAGIIVTAGMALSVSAALDCSHTSFGYIASFDFAIIFRICVIVSIVGLPLMMYWRTRSTGVALFGTGIAMYLAFIGCIGILKKFDKVAWQHEPPAQASGGPNQQASLIIYYRPGTTDRQIEDFVENKLESNPSNVQNGRDFPAFVVVYEALGRSAENGFDGSALIFTPGAHGIAVDSFVSMVKSDPRVAMIFRNMAPNDIHLPKAEHAPMPLTGKRR